MTLADISPLVLTYNEEENIQRCLSRLTWAHEVIVVDSCSTDQTPSLAGKFPNARVVPRPFDNHTAQWNFGVDQCRSPWILALDADYTLEAGFEEELSQLQSDSRVAFFASFRYVIFDRALRGSLYPPRAVLFHRDHCRYIADGHTQLLNITGESAALQTRIRHDDRKPLSRWLRSQDNYAQLEAAKLGSLPIGQLSLQDRLRRAIVPAPALAFFYSLVIRGTLFDGWRGWYYALQRAIAEILLSLRLLDHHFSNPPPHEPK